MLSRQFISYPKSGRSWIRYVLLQLGLDSSIRFHHDQFEFNDGSMPDHNFDFRARFSKYKKVDKVVYLERDPRDVIVSLYYQVTGRFNDFFDYQGSISDFIRDDYFGADNLKKFHDLWGELSTLDNVLVVRYEDCHMDMCKVIRTILDFYELRVDEEAIIKAVNNSSFEKMRVLEESSKFPKPWLRPRNNCFKVRNGLAGSHVEELSSLDLHYLDLKFNF